MKILIIDDCPADRNFYKKHIKESDLFSKTDIEECGSLKQAFKRFDDKVFDLIILDLGLPESNGIETITSVVSELKDRKCQTPIIILTGTEDHFIGQEAFKYGVKDFLIKNDVVKNEKELSRSITYATYSLNFKK